jgi:putative chitinase
MPMLRPPRIRYSEFFDAYRGTFGPIKQHTVDGLSYLLTRFSYAPQWTDLRHIAYALATIRTETGVVVQAIEELGGRTYLSKYYLRPALRRALGNIRLADAWNFKGRGYVQITGRRNYTLFSSLLGVDLINQPELATGPHIAFDIMTEGMHGGLFTGKALSDYITPTQASYYYARRIINGLDRASVIADDAKDFELRLRLAT